MHTEWLSDVTSRIYESVPMYLDVFKMQMRITTNGDILSTTISQSEALERGYLMGMGPTRRQYPISTIDT